MAYFEENSEAMNQLEAMVDKVGMANVLYALAHISAAKADHLETNWQDRSGAQWWTARANKLNTLAAKPFMHDCKPGSNVRAKTAHLKVA